MTAASDYVARVCKLAPTIAVHADRAEAERRLPAPLADALHDAGLFRMLLPRSLGGAELDPPTFVQVMEEIAKADASTAWVIGQTAGCSMIAAYLDREAAAKVFAPPLFDAVVPLAGDKTPRGGKHTLRESPVTQSMLAQADARLDAARVYVLATLEEILAEAGRTGALTLGQRVRIRQAASHATHE